MKKATFEEILKYILRGELDDDGFVEEVIADRSMNTFRDFLESIDDLNEVNSLKNRSGEKIDEDRAGILYRAAEYFVKHCPYGWEYYLDDEFDFPWMKLDEAPPHDNYKDNISTPNLASDCSNNRFPTAEKSTFSTTTTNHNFDFIDARSNYDNMNCLLLSSASNITAVPSLTVAKQAFEAQSKLFDRGIPSVVSPASLMAAKHFFDEQSKLFDRGNPSTDLISTGLSEAGLVHEDEAQCIFNCRCGQIQFWVRKHLGGYPYLCQDLKGYPLLSTFTRALTPEKTRMSILRLDVSDD